MYLGRWSVMHSERWSVIYSGRWLVMYSEMRPVMYSETRSAMSFPTLTSQASCCVFPPFSQEASILSLSEADARFQHHAAESYPHLWFLVRSMTNSTFWYFFPCSSLVTGHPCLSIPGVVSWACSFAGDDAICHSTEGDGWNSETENEVSLSRPVGELTVIRLIGWLP